MADFLVKPLEAGLDFEHLRYWDVVIIGAGPAGLAAGLTTAHRALTTLVIEAKNEPGGQPQFLYADKQIVDIPGFPDGITGEDLSERTYRQAVNALVQFRFDEELVAIEDTDEMEADDPLISDYQGTHVAVVGGGDSALDAALMVLGRGGHVDLIVREPVPVGKADTLARVRDADGVVRTSTEITAARLQDGPIRLTLTGGDEIDCPVVIVQIGFLSAKDTFERLGVRLNEDGSIAIDPYFETSRRGLFAVGDVHGDIKLIAVAWAEGIQAAIHAFKEITSPYWLNEKRLRDSKIALIGEKIAQAARTRRKTR